MRRCDFMLATAVMVGLLPTGGQADGSVLDRYIGSWDMHVKTFEPNKPDINYSEVYEWVLDHQFIRGKTGRKPDGSEDVIFGTYDSRVDGYPFWIFSSSGTYAYLAPATWDKRKRLMEWKNPSGWDVNYLGRCLFPDDYSRHCSLTIKDWKGKVLLRQEWTATRSDR